MKDESNNWESVAIMNAANTKSKYLTHELSALLSKIFILCHHQIEWLTSF